MSSTRTQVYLTNEQRREIDQIARARGVTMAAVIRATLDRYLAETNDPAIGLAASFGADPEIAVPERDEWNRG